MKTFKNNKGFTLIELLAVIVILAIVTVVATRSILPYMANAGRDTFVAEANLAITGASDAMSLIQLGKADGQYVTSDVYEGEGENKVKTSTKYCFTIENLNSLGTWQKDDSNYEGRVVVTVPVGGNAYTYAVNMHSKEYYVNSASGTLKDEDGKSYNASDFATGGSNASIKFDCTDY